MSRWPWLQYSDEVEIACFQSKNFGNAKAGKPSFISGSKQFRLPTATDNEKCPCHIQAVETKMQY